MHKSSSLPNIKQSLLPSLYNNNNTSITSINESNFKKLLLKRPKVLKINYNNYEYQNRNNSSLSIRDTNSTFYNTKKILPKPIWNYSYNRNCSFNFKPPESERKKRIKKILKQSYLFAKDKRPRMIKILENNSMIEQQIRFNAWKYYKQFLGNNS